MSEFATESKSSVTVDGTAKGDAVPKVKAYDGVTEDEMNRLSDLAVRTYVATLKRLGAERVSLP